MDNEQRFFTVNEFAKLARTTRNTLHHYDAIDLLSPVSRSENNNYRYYSIRQLTDINMIRTLQALGMPLSEIKTLKASRTPERAEELFTQLLDKINKKIDVWVCAQKLLFTLRKSVHSVGDVNEDAITIQFLPAEAIVLGDLNDYSRGRNDYNALVSFYHTISKKWPDLDLNYPVWAVFSEERIKRGDWVWPERYYFYNPEGRDKKPAALYAIGYTRGGYGQGDELYHRMLDFIDKNRFEICGDAYEEYPLNEVCVSNDADYLMRVMITVREKNQKHAE
ncbi:MAG: MerR family transcriptional regulator [Planctomycetaceae bacterium]|nr:MerR family transcriptional regulator [Planctomycetaceae bacterium]